MNEAWFSKIVSINYRIVMYPAYLALRATIASETESPQCWSSLDDTKRVFWDRFTLNRRFQFIEAVKQFEKKILRVMIDDWHHKIGSYETMKEACQVSCTATLSTEHFLAFEEAFSSTCRDARLEKISALRRSNKFSRNLIEDTWTRLTFTTCQQKCYWTPKHKFHVRTHASAPPTPIQLILYRH